MARLLERAAPGVRSTSRRLTRVMGVAESVGAASGAPETLMICLLVATLKEKCRTGCDPELTRTFCAAWLKVGAATVTAYSPRETLLKMNWPVASVVALVDHADVFERSMTMAFSTGRCWESWTMPRTDPKMEAKAAMAAGRPAAERMMRVKRIEVSHSLLVRACLKSLRSSRSSSDDRGSARMTRSTWQDNREPALSGVEGRLVPTRFGLRFYPDQAME